MSVRIPGRVVTIAEVDTTSSVIEFHTTHGVDAIGQLTFTMALPLPSHVVDGATIVVQTRAHTDEEFRTIFEGSVRASDGVIDSGGKWITLTAESWLHIMEFPLNEDIVWAGGAGTSPALLVGAARHLGDSTEAKYAVPTAEGTSFDATWEPAVDSSFVRLTGKLHGTNNDLMELTNAKITNYSRVEIRQGGEQLGYMIFPESGDDPDASYNVVEEFGDEDGVWVDFDLTIAAKLVAGGGTARARFISAYRPAGDRDDFEVQQVRRQTAAKMTARQIIRALFKVRGLGGSSGISYIVDEVTSVSGVVIELGGNGAVDNGQIRIPSGESPLGFIKRIGKLFGYATFDSPDGTPRFRAVRGVPPSSATIDATFTEGVNAYRFRRARDLKPTINYWEVLGAAGTNPDGTTFQYQSLTETHTPPSNPHIPLSVGWVKGTVQDELLVSDDLCLYCRNIMERNSQDGYTEIEWEAEPKPSLQPGRVVIAESPTVDMSGRLWIMRIRHDWTDSGYSMTLTGWTGSGSEFPLSSDPDPDEDDADPVPTPSLKQWQPYPPRAGV